MGPIKPNTAAACCKKEPLLPFEEANQEKGSRIKQAAKTALYALAISFAFATTALAFTACFISGSWIVPAIIVSAVALSILFTAIISLSFKPYLNKQMLTAFNYIRATAVDLLAKLAMAALYPFSQTYFDPKKCSSADYDTPILLVHGYLHNSSGWAYFRYRLKAAGYKNVFTINLGNPFLSIEEYAKRVQEKVGKIKKISGRDDIRFIGHSMGGIVSAYYAIELAKQGEVKSVITLGSPLNGTRLKGIGKCAKQMQYKSKFITDLQKKILAADIAFYHFGSKTDLLVRPASSAIIKENKCTVFENLGHVSYLLSNRVIRSCLSFYSEHKNPENRP